MCYLVEEEKGWLDCLTGQCFYLYSTVMALSDCFQQSGILTLKFALLCIFRIPNYPGHLNTKVNFSIENTEHRQLYQWICFCFANGCKSLHNQPQFALLCHSAFTTVCECAVFSWFNSSSLVY